MLPLGQLPTAWLPSRPQLLLASAPLSPPEGSKSHRLATKWALEWCGLLRHSCTWVSVPPRYRSPNHYLQHHPKECQTSGKESRPSPSIPGTAPRVIWPWENSAMTRTHFQLRCRERQPYRPKPWGGLPATEGHIMPPSSKPSRRRCLVWDLGPPGSGWTQLHALGTVWTCISAEVAGQGAATARQPIGSLTAEGLGLLLSLVNNANNRGCCRSGKMRQAPGCSWEVGIPWGTATVTQAGCSLYMGRVTELPPQGLLPLADSSTCQP